MTSLTSFFLKKNIIVMKMDKQLNRLGTAPINKLLMEYIPAALAGFVTYALYNIVDRIFIGQYSGTIGIAALSAVFPLTMFLIGFEQMVEGGVATLVPIYLGEKKTKKAEKILGTALGLAFIISILEIIIVYTCSAPILKLFIDSPEVIFASQQYMQILVLGAPFMTIGFILEYAVRAEGFPKFALMMMLVSSIVNIALDALFIIVFDMGLTGAALATALAQTTHAAMGVGHFLSKRGVLHIHPNMLIPNFKTIATMLPFGIPAASMDFMGGLEATILVKQLSSHGGAASLATLGIILAIDMFIMMPIYAIGEGISTIIGFNYGAKEKKRYWHAVKIALCLMLIIAISGLLIIELFPHTLSRFFLNTTGNQVNQQFALRIALLALPLSAINLLACQFFLSTGNAGKANLLAFTKPLLIFIPMILILSSLWSTTGIWISLPASEAVAFILAAFLLLREYRK